MSYRQFTNIQFSKKNRRNINIVQSNQEKWIGMENIPDPAKIMLFPTESGSAMWQIGYILIFNLYKYIFPCYQEMTKWLSPKLYLQISTGLINVRH